MQVYLVGGAVRDELLHLPVRERDWVVVGGTPEQMTSQGYRAVGREFPVFLHPETSEEYALARLERKVAPGYRGFVTEFSPAVTLEEDLLRRDLTINAMARDAGGAVIDPYGGQADLAARVLRHVSPAFAEDPVRILRVARFAARFAPLGFTIAPDTLALMRGMVGAGEASALVSERVWRELERALGEPQPARFFEVLADCGALAVVLPELATSAGTAPAMALAALRAAALAAAPVTVSWAVLLADLSAVQVEALCARLRAPGEFRDLALLMARLAALWPPGDARSLLSTYEAADAFRRPGRFAQWVQAMTLRLGTAGQPPEATAALAGRLRAGFEAAAAARLDPALIRQLPGPEIAAQLRALRLAAIDAALD